MVSGALPLVDADAGIVGGEDGTGRMMALSTVLLLLLDCRVGRDERV